MSFETELLARLGGASDVADIDIMLRRAYFYDFDGYPTRLWDGVGILNTATGVGDDLTLSDGTVIASNEWIGTISADGTNLHQRPPLADPREGTSPRYEFGIPYLDAPTFAALQADQSKVRGRDLTVYRVIFSRGEGLRPATSIAFAARLEMMGTRFDRSLVVEGGTMVNRHSATVLCRSLEYGRSRFPGGTYNDTTQQERARLLGLSSDSGCAFVARNANRTYTFD
ncbi:hypothetical protein ATO6_15335 [Oceanicola sp. 22II-s10i]|uniref:hypothetical protein n=1 Tax=Oceanicola sp. 22II-s10i TaxID=1317116 RepID=UPI000B52165E|nr:hypothetical protein [Oceanicola sp. 22II-s10i]OWU83804.1 hypothetical protein ATO6_15335 [Oceanicola sp. 22II-s10i]